MFAYEIEPMLFKVTKTASGRDDILYWLFSCCSDGSAKIFALNYTYNYIHLVLMLFCASDSLLSFSHAPKDFNFGITPLPETEIVEIKLIGIINIL
jgi:hypothetical protein